MVKGLLVYASGKVEEVRDPAGLYIHKRETCSHCDQGIGKERKFKLEWAHDSDEPSNGTLVYIEVPT